VGNYFKEEDLKKVFAEIEKIEDQYEGEAQRSSVLAIRSKTQSLQVDAKINVGKSDAVSVTALKVKEILYKYWPREKV
jgi:hypothetical protein